MTLCQAFSLTPYLNLKRASSNLWGMIPIVFIFQVTNSWNGILTGNVAFSARLHKDMTSSKSQETVVFGTIVTNIGSAYSPSSGIFTAPSDGIYGFAWTLLTYPNIWFNSQLVVDGQTQLYQAINSRGGRSYESSGCSGVLNLKAGQRVWIRKQSVNGDKLHAPWSSFSGWQIQ